MSHLADMAECPLHRRTPYGITGVSQTQFSVARHYGGCTYNGERYRYYADTDELVRADVVNWLNARKKAAAKAAKEAQPKAETGKLL